MYFGTPANLCKGKLVDFDGVAYVGHGLNHDVRQGIDQISDPNPEVERAEKPLLRQRI